MGTVLPSVSPEGNGLMMHLLCQSRLNTFQAPNAGLASGTPGTTKARSLKEAGVRRKGLQTPLLSPNTSETELRFLCQNSPGPCLVLCVSLRHLCEAWAVSVPPLPCLPGQCAPCR